MTQHHSSAPSLPERPSALTVAMREARIEAAERTGVIVDLHGAQLARLEMLNDALEPLFASIPKDVDLFDRGLTPGDPPRLWIDMLAHVAMAHDTRVYRFLQDTRYGRKVLAESAQIEPVVQAVTQYVARRLIERERALASSDWSQSDEASAARRRSPSAAARFWRGVATFVVGAASGIGVLLALAWVAGSKIH
jgi:hypothetical protein